MRSGCTRPASRTLPTFAMNVATDRDARRDARPFATGSRPRAPVAPPHFADGAHVALARMRLVVFLEP
eukprot:2823773-Prymnesium_polylepis.1